MMLAGCSSASPSTGNHYNPIRGGSNEPPHSKGEGHPAFPFFIFGASTRFIWARTSGTAGRLSKTGSAAVGVELYVDRVVHGRGGGVGFFVGVDGGGVLQRCADIVKALQ